MAAKMGLPFSYAHFFGNGAENGPLIVESYCRHFQPSASLAELVNVGVHVRALRPRKRLCAGIEPQSDEAAQRHGGAVVPSVEEALAYPYQPEELAYLDQVKRSYVDGNPPQVKAKLEDLADLYQTTD